MADEFQIIPYRVRSAGTDVPPEEVQAGINSLALQTTLALNSLAGGGGTIPSGNVTYNEGATGAVTRTLTSRLQDFVSVKDFGAVCNGVTDDSAAFQLAINSVTAGTQEIWVPSSALINSNLTASTGTVTWRMAEGAFITGTGSLPFWSSPLAYILTPTVGARTGVWHGTTANPTTDGVTPTSYTQRVDHSVVGDNAAHLIFTKYNVLRRLVGGTGWLTTNYNYLEDASTSGAAQSVAVTGSAHATGNASVWGLYSEAHAEAGSTNPTLTGLEVDVFNSKGSDYAYTDSAPATLPFSAGVWIPSVGANKNSWALGIGYVGTAANNWHTGMWLENGAVDHIGIDIQAQPPTLINLKNGASTDGTGTTPGGVGLDCGSGNFGSGANNCAVHLRNQRMGFGTFGFWQYDSVNSFFAIWASTSSRLAYFNLVSPGFVVAGYIQPSSTAGIIGTTTNDSANAGSVGEYATASAAGTSLTSGTPINATSFVNLSAGDWDVQGIVQFVAAVGTVPTQYLVGINTTSATFGPFQNNNAIAATFTTSSAATQSTPTVRISLAAAANVYLVAQAQFTTSTMTCNGFLRARRVR